MTTLEAILPCLRNTRLADLSNAAAEDLACLIRALNEGIQDYFDLAPAAQKRTTFSHYLAAPETVTGITIAHGETVAADGACFTAEQRGCTIFLEDDPTVHEVVAADAILKPYLGHGAAPYTGRLYHDAVPLVDFAIERIVSHPRIGTRTISERVLARCAGEGRAEVLHREEGTPRTYRVDYVGGSVQSETDALVVLRLHPLPDEAMTVTFEADVRPLAYAVTALHEPREIPVSRTRANHLLPLIEAHLIGTPIWTGSTSTTQRVREREQEARRLCALVAEDFARPARRAGTAWGW